MKKVAILLFIFLSFCSQEDTLENLAIVPEDPTSAEEVQDEEATTTSIAILQLDSFENISYSIIKEESRVGYLAPKQFLNTGLETVEGFTNEIIGEFTLSLAECDQADSCLLITNLIIRADISALKSNSVIRDNALNNQWLQSTLFPEAVFRKDELVLPNRDFDSKIEDTIVGKLTIREIELDTPFSITAYLDGDKIYISGFTEIDTTWFGFDAPTKFNAWEVLNPIGIKVELVAGLKD
jgi:polyisoprenoid-binding protein YceI